jgi:SAM-dependent methyltransferase
MIQQRLDRLRERVRARVADVIGRGASARTSRSGGRPVPERPIPPAEIRYRIASRDYSETEYLTHGQSLCEGFMQEMHMYGVQPKRILDFGCGCGRIIRHFIARGDIECHGTDADAVGVQWCRDNLPGGAFAVNDRLPPLPYRKRMFDFIYAHSVFTHIDLSSQVAWLREFRRVTVPGGLVRITTMGEGGFRGLGDAIPRHVQEEFVDNGFVFFRNFTDGVLPEWYQSTFHSTKFGRELFEEHLGKVVEFRPGIPTEEWKDPQDTYIIRVGTPRPWPRSMLARLRVASSSVTTHTA